MIDNMAGECSTSSGKAGSPERKLDDMAEYAGLTGFELAWWHDKPHQVLQELVRQRVQLLAALELADQILARDGLQELRGLAWHDGERWQIQEAIRRAKGER